MTACIRGTLMHSNIAPMPITVNQWVFVPSSFVGTNTASTNHLLYHYYQPSLGQFPLKHLLGFMQSRFGRNRVKERQKKCTSSVLSDFQTKMDARCSAIVCTAPALYGSKLTDSLNKKSCSQTSQTKL